MRLPYTIACGLAFPSLIRTQAVNLGTSGTFGILGATTVTNTGPTFILGDIGVSPGTAITGFPPGSFTGSLHNNDAVATHAQADALTAYNVVTGLAHTADETGIDLGGLTLTPGVYFFSSSAQLTGTLTLDALGDTSALFIFQIGSTLTTASNSAVALINGAQACNVIWQVGSSATLGTGTVFIGIILAHTSIDANSGALISGSLIALNGAVTLQDNTIEVANTCTSPVTSASSTSTATSPTSTTSSSTSATISTSSTFTTSSISSTSSPSSISSTSTTSSISSTSTTSSISSTSTTSSISSTSTTLNTSSTSTTSTTPSTSSTSSTSSISSTSTTLSTSSTSTTSSISSTSTTSSISSTSTTSTTPSTSSTSSTSSISSTSTTSSTSSTSTTSTISSTSTTSTTSSTGSTSTTTSRTSTTITTTTCTILTKSHYQESCTCYKFYIVIITKTCTTIVPCSTSVVIPTSPLWEDVVELSVVPGTVLIMDQALNALATTLSGTTQETASSQAQSGAPRSAQSTEGLSPTCLTASVIFIGVSNRLVYSIKLMAIAVIGMALKCFQVI